MPTAKSRFLSAAQLILSSVLALSILGAPTTACFYAALALQLWFERMIPSLFPFMVLSGLILRLNLGQLFALPLYPVLGRLYRISKTMCTTLFMGFFFGFPLGAKCVAEAYELKQLSKPQAQFLLSFCNNIGPVYLLSFALPLLGFSENSYSGLKIAVIAIFFGVPLLYGLILRNTVYRHIPLTETILCGESIGRKVSFIPALDASVTSACAAITRLGGYMIFFIVCNLPLRQTALLAPALEITSGLTLSKGILPPALSMTFLTFGGLSCFAQTYTCIRDTDLSFRDYCFHKLLQSAIAFCLYALLFSVYDRLPVLS
ncbi:MAG: hypothetical protein K2P64_05930 [Lachnospiraceae bacterium]|nr:hypothetical protein [Lachnospiraceae bacterium]